MKTAAIKQKQKVLESELQLSTRKRKPKVISFRTANKVKISDEKRPDMLIRYDRLDHWPEVDHNKCSTRCKMDGCDKLSFIYCSKCKVHLCFNGKKNCYKEFHLSNDFST